MGVAESSITVVGLSKADTLDIGAVDSNKQITFTPVDNIGGRYGEPVTMSALLAFSALGVLAAWIVKTRRRSTVELEVEIRGSDGSSRRTVFKKEVTSETSEADVLKALADLTQVGI
jgi:hypothetical protein